MGSGLRIKEQGSKNKDQKARIKKQGGIKYPIINTQITKTLYNLRSSTKQLTNQTTNLQPTNEKHAQ